MASISKPLCKDKHGINIYQIDWREPDGKKRSKRVHGEAQAKAFKRKVENEVEKGQYIPGAMTVEAYVTKWLESVKKTKKHRTFVDYKLISQKHIVLTLGKLKLDEVKPLHIRHYLEELLGGGRIDGAEGGLHPTTIKKHRRTLHLIFETAVEDDLIPVNPVKRVKMSKIIPKSQERKFVPVTLDRVGILTLLGLVAADKKLEMPVNVALFTGARQGEALALRWKNVDLERRVANITENLYRQKTDKGSALVFGTPKTGTRQVALPKTLVTLLRQEKKRQAANKLAWGPAYQDHDLVCCQENGKPWEPPGVTRKFRKLVKDNGLPNARFHDLRHTLCSTMSEELGISANTVALQAGHADPGFTSKVYIHSSMSAQLEAVDAFDRYLSEGGVSPKEEPTKGVSLAR